MAKHLSEILQTPEHEWITFPGGELEGRRPRRLCPACREALNRAVLGATGAAGPRQPLCFQCYRLELDRERSLKAAGALDTSSQARFQDALPFETVNRSRLVTLKAERSGVRSVSRQGVGQFADRRRQAQIAARHALQTIAVGVQSHQMADADRESAFVRAVHAAELQLPESWLPFVVAR